jgi:quinol monooxygenase YgiN
VPLNLNVVQLLVRLAPPQAVVDDVLYALRAVMRGAQQARGCRFAQICRQANEARKIEYVEEWDDEGALRGQFGSERFLRLLALLETGEECPVVEFRTISKTDGLDYIAAVGSTSSLRSAH